MPSHTAASALIKLFFLDGAPWKWSTWQDRTGIRHGLFPLDDKLLPAGLTRQDSIDIKSYFQAYQELSSEDAKIRFATKSRGNSNHPGRTAWNAFVSRNWNRWGFNSVIIGELKEYDVHPQDIVMRENLHDSWPNADGYAPIILDSLGMALFGEEAFPLGTEVLRHDLRSCLRIFVQRTWSTIRSQVAGLKNRSREIEAIAIAAFHDLEEGKPTKAKVTRTIRAVAKWKECAELFNTSDNIQTAEDMLAELQRIMETLGAKVISKKLQRTSKQLCKVSTVALRGLATQEDVDDVLNVYHEYFDMVEDEDGPPITDAAPHGLLRADQNEGDFGMEVEASMSTLDLSQALGFMRGVPPLFNKYRHRSGITAWEDPDTFDVRDHEIPPLYLDRNRLHWHQYAGVHSIARNIFTLEREPNHTTGMLIADEVGLGKTAQALTFITFLNQIIWRKAQDLTLPPIIVEHKYLAGHRKIPSLPHLVFCPGTLVAQWVSECKTLFCPRSIDILIYDGQTKGAVFWGPSGPVRSSRHSPHHLVIVASHSVVFTDFKNIFQAPKRKNALPWTIPRAKVSDESLVNTIFGHSFLSITVDEAHHMRNPGKRHLATLRLLQQATVRLIMTATPLHTAPKDISSLARLVGIPYFSTEDSIIEEKSDAARLRRAKKEDDEGDSIRAAQLHIVKRHQERCVGHFLRRTTDSVNYLGKPLIDIPPYMEIIGLIKLTPRETAILQDRAEAAKAAILSSSNARMHTKKFYLEYRLAVGYAKDDPSSPLPTFRTLREWNHKMSMKMDVCAMICAHYLQDDSVDDIFFEEGLLKCPDPPPTPTTKDRRIIIYAEFPSMAPLLQNVLGLYLVNSLAINGKISFQERDKRIQAFHDDDDARVLIFSSVGSAGLNLAIADIVIFFDQPWSAQDERQIRGRAHRQPQDKVVKVIYLLAQDSADPLMHEVARGKRDMFDAFVNKELGEEMRALLEGCAPDTAPPDGDISGEDENKPKPKPSRRRKAIVVDDDLPLPPDGGEADESRSAGDVEDVSLEGRRLPQRPPAPTTPAGPSQPDSEDEPRVPQRFLKYRTASTTSASTSAGPSRPDSEDESPIPKNFPKHRVVSAVSASTSGIPRYTGLADLLPAAPASPSADHSQSESEDEPPIPKNFPKHQVASVASASTSGVPRYKQGYVLQAASASPSVGHSQSESEDEPPVPQGIPKHKGASGIPKYNLKQGYALKGKRGPAVDEDEEMDKSDTEFHTQQVLKAFPSSHNPSALGVHPRTSSDDPDVPQPLPKRPRKGTVGALHQQPVHHQPIPDEAGTHSKLAQKLSAIAIGREKQRTEARLPHDMQTAAEATGIRQHKPKPNPFARGPKTSGDIGRSVPEGSRQPSHAEATGGTIVPPKSALKGIRLKHKKQL